MGEERMKPGHWSGSVLCIPFSALTLIAGGSKDNACTMQTLHIVIVITNIITSTGRLHIPLITKGSLLEQVEVEQEIPK